MDKLAKEPAGERELYFTQAASEMSLVPSIIEKDFWVCWTLRRLFTLESVKDNLLFKGGTSLSKVYGLIRRFSEDIDISIHRESLGFGGEQDPANPELSNNARQRQTEALGEAARRKVFDAIKPELEHQITDLLGGEEWSLDSDPTDPENQSLVFFYPATSLTPLENAYIRPAVKIEFGARSDHWPDEMKTLTPYVADVVPKAMEEAAVEVKVMGAQRTFWEKATILHQMAHLPEHRDFPNRYSRHYTDLAAMAEARVVEPEDNEQDSLLAAVVAHKMIFFRCGWANYPTAKRGTLRLFPGENRIGDLSQDLDSMREMFFDKPPRLESVLKTLREWEVQFNQSPL